MPLQKAGEEAAPKYTKDDLKVGQKVRYHPVGGGMQLTEGVIKEIVTHPEVKNQ